MLGMEYFGIRNADCGIEFKDQRTSTSIANSELRNPHFKGRVAAYAAGPDYHRFLWDRLNALADWLKAEAPGSSAHGVTDTAPLLERDFARRAGLGWVGKNTMLINRERGSFFFLGALLTDLELRPDPPHEASHCGTCTACLDACPTAAFPEPGVLDARRCVSYLTIELRSPIPEEHRPALGGHVYGCDICQEVCPYNQPAPSTTDTPWQPRAGLDLPRLVDLWRRPDAELRALLKGSAMTRAKLVGLRRNLAVAIGNGGDPDALALLQEPSADRPSTQDPLVQEHITWAIERRSK
jgi:epoxyqueuosine reductase